MRPIPIRARRLNEAPSFAAASAKPAARVEATSDARRAWEHRASVLPPFMNSRQRRHHEPVRLLGADAHAQRVRQAVARDLAQDQAARGESLVGIGRGFAAGLRENG